MEPAVTLNPLAVASHAFRPGEILDDAEAMKGGNDPRFPFVVASCNGLRQGAFFEFYIMLCDFRKVAPRHRGDAKSLARFECHEPFGDELRQRFAESAYAKAISLGQVGKL